MHYSQILIRPLISEKATWAKETANQVVFYVHQNANKIQVRQAVEEAFGVKVKAVNVVKQSVLSRKRFGRPIGKISGYKKAYVTLAEGETIEFFEGV